MVSSLMNTEHCLLSCRFERIFLNLRLISEETTGQVLVATLVWLTSLQMLLVLDKGKERKSCRSV